MAYPGSSGSNHRSHKWLFNKTEMLNAKTIKEGWAPEKELEYRQKTTRCIQEMVDRLNDQMKDKAGKVTQLCMCAASIHMHRFYYFHSFDQFKYLDVAAACLFLAGKSEESPRKLDHIVHVWWAMKFPKYRRFPQNNPQIFSDAKAYIVQLENIVLQTIAFDLKIDLPHPIVLNLTNRSIGQVQNDHGNKKLTECAYFFATDVLCVTNWAIRYSAAEIAVCCVDIVCKFGKHEIPKRGDGSPWYHGVCDLSSQRLEEMEKEFINIYQSVKFKLALHKFASKGIVYPPEQRGLAPEQLDEPLLPPPPTPPQMPKNVVGINEYKERNKMSQNNRTQSEKPRESFMPDVSSVSSGAIGLPPLNLPGMSSTNSSGHDRHRDDRREEDRRKDKDRERRNDERRHEDKERRKEEERRKKEKEEEKRKRDHNRISGYHNDGLQAHKKPRPDVLQNFIPASSSNHSTSNGNHKGHRGGATTSLAASMKVPAALSPPRAPPSLGNLVPEALAPPPQLRYPLKPSNNDLLEEGELE